MTLAVHAGRVEQVASAYSLFDDPDIGEQATRHHRAALPQEVPSIHDYLPLSRASPRTGAVSTRPTGDACFGSWKQP
jgi:hypothetical protein